MSVYNKPDIKTKAGTNTTSYIHKKTNSLNFSPNAQKFLRESSNKFKKNNLELRNDSKDDIENNVINNNTNDNSNINKLLTTTNKNNKKIEININKNYSPTSRLNKTGGDNIILLRHKYCNSQNNINDNSKNNTSSHNARDTNNKKCNIILNNNINEEKEKKVVKNKNLNNINININISKKIISTYYNKTKDKSNIIIKKNNSLNSVNNSGAKDNENYKFYKMNSKEGLNQLNNGNIIKNQSASALKKISNNEISMNNISQNKNSLNLNSLGHFSTNSNMSTNTNKNNCSKSNLNLNNSKQKNIHINYTSNDIYNNNNINNSNSNDKEIFNKKNQGNMLNKIIKENKSLFLSQIQIPVNSSSPRNINSIQNYLKYLHLGQNTSKNHKNSPYDRFSKNQKLKDNNIMLKHNKTENNTTNITFNYDFGNALLTQNNHKYNKKNINDIPKGESNKKIKKETAKNFGTKRNRPNVQNNYNSNSNSIKKEMDGLPFECPEQLHYFFVKMFQKGKNINFDKEKK